MTGWLLVGVLGLPPIPESMTFCGMQARITPQARHAIQQYMIKLHEHPPTLEAVVARAESLMPYIEEAIAYIGVPEDLKYLALQESRLNPHAVSKSQAVGYWQFKDFTAREVGLVVNDTIDERKHLFRSSAGAALYLSKQYQRHRNWLFAIIAYYEGGTGALPYIDTAYVGKQEICLHERTHWYALRLVAHKLVFEPLIRRRVYALLPFAYEGPPLPVQELARKHDISIDSFLLLNPWLVRPILPGGRPSTYYLPAQSHLSAIPQEPLKSLFSPVMPTAFAASVPAETLSVSSAEQTSLAAAQPTNLSSVVSVPSFAAAYLPLQKEPYLHQEWAYPPPPMTKRIARWNPFHTPGSPLLILPPRRAHIHIVQGGETLREIARHYRRRLDKLLAYNRLENPDMKLPKGFRVLLREERPYDEKPIIYQWR